MSKRKENSRRMFAAILIFLMLSSPVTAFAESKSPTSSESAAVSSQVYEGKAGRAITESFSYDGRVLLTLSGIGNKSLYRYERFDVNIVGTRLNVQGFRFGETDYIPFREAARAIGASYEYSAGTKTSVMRGTGLTVTASDGCFVTYANDRALFSESPSVIMNDGRMYIPIDHLAKAAGLTVKDNGGNVTLSGRISPILPASKFYREDEVLWLARIIHAESSGEPLIGQIAVGNVVLNRVKSAYYPNTIYGVIFDRKYGVQFSPILNGSIYNTPSYNSVLAAKICLDGYDLSEGAFFFLAPRYATSSWIPKSREYVFTIGNHDFYK